MPNVELPEREVFDRQVKARLDRASIHLEPHALAPLRHFLLAAVRRPDKFIIHQNLAEASRCGSHYRNGFLATANPNVK